VKFGLRLRVVAGLIVCLFLGYFWVSWSVRLGITLIRHYRGGSYVDCGSASWETLGYLCNTDRFSKTWAIVLLLVAGLLVLGICIGVARLALRPAGQMAEVVDRLGPQNLGERLTDRSRDELGRLSTAVNSMLDRVADGYEGQRRFAANASHELRTPLALQRALIEVSMAGTPTAEQLDLLTRQLLAANKRNEELIEGLLALAESDRGLSSSTPQRLDLIAGQAIANYRQLAEAAGVRVAEALVPVTVQGEGVLLERLVANLLHNAIKYNVPHGHVEVRVGPGSVLQVENSGDPVPQELLPTLFEPFRRLSGERINHSGGSGLGLTIVRSIVSAHDAGVTAISRPQGGLLVEVRFPADRALSP
jgi:signal transduction histidine kinase